MTHDKQYQAIKLAKKTFGYRMMQCKIEFYRVLFGNHHELTRRAIHSRNEYIANIAEEARY